jgi:transposase
LQNKKNHCQHPSPTTNLLIGQKVQLEGEERMLTMIQQHHIKYLYEYKGMSLRAIAKETGHSFQTIKKYANKEDGNPLPTPRKPKQSKLDPYKAQIDKWLEEDRKVPRKQRHTGTRVYRRLLEMYGEEFSVSLRTVQYYVAKKKQEMYQDGEGYLPLEHSPGEAQADFGSFTYQDKKGVEQEGFFLTLSFPYSNASYAQVVPGQNQECLLQGLKQIFEYIGGVPKRIWFDNLSAAVTSIHRNGKRTLTELFQKFALHYNFQYEFCNPNSGHEKGHVENKVGYIRRNFFVPVPVIPDIEEYNRTLLYRCDQDMDRTHYRKGKSIQEWFEEDKKAFGRLPKTSFDVYRLERAKADKYGKVRYAKNLYSTSPEFAQKEVWLKITYNRVIVLSDEYDIVMEHPRLYGEGLESMKWIPYLELMARRPRSLQNLAFYKELPDPWKEYLAYTSEKKKAIRLFGHIPVK